MTTIAAVQRAVADTYGLTVSELIGRDRSPRVAYPRQVAMYVARRVTGKSLPLIGRRFDGRDHTTIIHGIRRVEQRLNACSIARIVVAGIERGLAQ